CLVLFGVIWADQDKLRVLMKSVDRQTKEDRKYKIH
ncbi:hypothetical protein CN559_30600, partial [Bacillus pseudomycoides]